MPSYLDPETGKRKNTLRKRSEIERSGPAPTSIGKPPKNPPPDASSYRDESGTWRTIRKRPKKPAPSPDEPGPWYWRTLRSTPKETEQGE